MPSPRTLLPWLLGGAVGAAGILQSLHWKNTGTASTGGTALQSQLRELKEKNAMLQRENDSLRSLAQGGGELAVPQGLAARVEKELGLRFLSSPVLHRLASEELRDRITAAIESRHGPSGIDDRQEAYRLIGWLGAEDELLVQLAGVRAVGARGWFDDVTGEGWVTDRYDLNSIPDQASLVRLLARILLHQHFPPAPAYPGDDAARAREALHSGAAAGAEARFYTANARAIGFMPMKENSEAAQLFKSLPAFIQGLVTFPATEGKGLADTLYVQGQEPFLTAFRNPPQTTCAISRPDTPPAAPAPLELPATPEEPFLTESAGMLGLRLWLDPARGAEISRGWKNDRYMLFPDGEASPALLWDIELESPAAADRLQEAALKIIGSLAAVESPVSLGKETVTAEKRHLLLTRPSPTRLRFLNTAVAATATTLGAR